MNPPLQVLHALQPAREHASASAIRILRGKNAGKYAAGFYFNPDKLMACNGEELSGPFFGPRMADALLAGDDQRWAMPHCRRCAALVVGALAIRSATDLSTVKDLLR